MALELVEKNPQNLSLLYHTEEYTGRFPSYSVNRNFFDGTNGEHIIPWGSGTCHALDPMETNHREIVSFEFAVVPPGHPLYSHGHPLPDGRRFIVWIYR